MIELMKLLLSLSVSASVVALLLFACKPLYRDRLSKTWQYYIWLVVVVRLLVPFAPGQNLIGLAVDRTAAQTQEAAQSGGALSGQIAAAARAGALGQADGAGAAPAAVDREQPAQSTASALKDLVMRNLLVIWFVPAAVLFARKLTSYRSFVRYIRAGREEVDDGDILEAYRLACADAGVAKAPPIYRNALAVSPMLVGVLRPCIVLPDLAVGGGELRLVLRHELTHYKRCDILYKWLVQIAVCVHWFNPLVHLVSREVGKNCELSCDEAVIVRLLDDDKERYGETLLATVKAGGVYNDAVASLTLSEDGKQLKERLHAILKFRPGSTAAKAVALGLAFCVLCAAAYAGAYRGMRVSAASAEEAADVFVFLAQDQYRHLATATPGTVRQVSYQVDNAHTALLIAQEGAGSFHITVRDSAGGTVQSQRALSLAGDGDPVIVFSAPRGVYSLELDVPAGGPASVAVYGAGLDRDSAIGVPSLDSLQDSISDSLQDSIGEGVSGIAGGIVEGITREITQSVMQEVQDGILDGIFGGIYDWEQWDRDYGDRWSNWADTWEDVWSEWGGGFEGNEGWRHLDYLYEDGYLVGAGVPLHDSPDNYSHTVTVTAGGNDYTVAFDDATWEAYGGNAKVLALVERIVAEHAPRRGTQTTDTPFYLVRSVLFNTDAPNLLRDLYDTRSLVEFMEMAGHCAGDAVIEELLYKAAGDGESLYFLFLADELPAGFGGAADLAREAVDKGDIIMLSALERFLTSSEYNALMMELLGMDDMPFM